MFSVDSQLLNLEHFNSVFERIDTMLPRVLTNFERIRSTSRNVFDVENANSAQKAYQRVAETLDQVNSQIHTSLEKSDIFSSGIHEGISGFDALYDKLQNLVREYATLENLKKATILSDTFTNDTVQISFLLDDQESVSKLNDAILEMAQEVRSPYVDLFQVITKIGLMTDGTFSNLGEIMSFTKLLNKSILLSGNSTEDQKRILDQMIQTLSSGNLSESDLFFYLEKMPDLMSTIETYFESSNITGTLKDWASQGLITSDIIKNALFSASDSINEKFSKLPATWEQIGNKIKNIALESFIPVLEKLNELANSGRFDLFFDRLSTLLKHLSSFAILIIDRIVDGIIWIGDNMDWLGPLITQVATAFLAFKVIDIVSAMATRFTSLLSNKFFVIFLVILLVIAGIYLLIKAINDITGESISATGLILGLAFAFTAGINNIVAAFWNFLVDIAELIWNLLVDVGNFLGNCFNDPIGSLAHLLTDFADFVLGLLQSLANAFDTLFGTNTAATIQGWRDALEDWADTTLSPQIEYWSKQDLSDIKLTAWNVSDAWNSGYALGEEFDRKFSKFFTSNVGLGAGRTQKEDYFNFDWDSIDPNGLLDTVQDTSSPGAYDTGSLGAISGDTAAIRENTARSEEDLSLLREIAEREAINRFTTAEVKVDMTGMNNTIHSDMDIDGFITVFTDRFAEALTATAEGVHV